MPVISMPDMYPYSFPLYTCHSFNFVTVKLLHQQLFGRIMRIVKVERELIPNS